MAENETTETQETTDETTEAVETQAPATEDAPAATEEVTEAPVEEEEEDEEISYHAVEKEGEITAIWEMQGQKHLRTISARSGEGQKILSLFTSEIHETDAPPMSETTEASA